MGAGRTKVGGGCVWGGADLHLGCPPPQGPPPQGPQGGLRGTCTDDGKVLVDGDHHTTLWINASAYQQG